MLAWGYGHIFVFASIAALGAGLQVAVDTTHGATALSPAVAALTVAVPVLAFLAAAYLLHPGTTARPPLSPIAATCLLILGSAIAATWVGVPNAVLAMGLIVGGLVAYKVRAMQLATA
jgi:low temperature requirement protein LtrA